MLIPVSELMPSDPHQQPCMEGIMTKRECLKNAIDITKEYCRGGDVKISPEVVLEALYDKLKTLTTDADSTS